MEFFKDGIGRKAIGAGVADVIAIIAPFVTDVPAVHAFWGIVIITVSYMAANIVERLIK